MGFFTGHAACGQQLFSFDLIVCSNVIVSKPFVVKRYFVKCAFDEQLNHVHTHFLNNVHTNYGLQILRVMDISSCCLTFNRCPILSLKCEMQIKIIHILILVCKLVVNKYSLDHTFFSYAVQIRFIRQFCSL